MSFLTPLNFLTHKIHRLPLIVLYLTDGCNSRCQMCNIWQNPRHNMSMDLVQRIVNECKSLGVKWVLLSGGEAMQHPQWHEIASLFQKQGIRVMLLTNGLLLPKHANRLQYIDDLIVSLDAVTPELYKQIRGVDALDLVINGIDIARQQNIHVTTRTTVMAQNYQQIPDIIDLAFNHDVNQISFLPIDVANPVAFGERDFQTTDIPFGALTHEQIAELEDIILQLPQTHAYQSGRLSESTSKLNRILVNYFYAILGETSHIAPQCTTPHFSIVIEWDSTLRPCYFLPSIGKMTNSLKQDVNVPIARALRQAYQQGKRAECQTCVCPLYKSARQLMTM